MRSIYRLDLFQGTHVLVTGGGTGIGFAIAKRFAEHQANVTLVSRNPAHLKPAADELRGTLTRVHWIACDVRDAAACRNAVEEAESAIGPVDVLVNGASGNFPVPSETMSPNAWAAVRGIVLDGSWNMSQAVGTRMLSRRKGVIVNLLATYAWGAAPYLAHNAAAKAGVLSITRTLAMEWADRGVRVVAVAPGPVDTPQSRENLWKDPEVAKRMIERVALKRFGTPEEVADCTLFVASPAASYMTGECVVLDGGEWLNHSLLTGVGARPAASPAPKTV